MEREHNPARESPQTPFERFQQCFRNMGVVNGFEETRGYQMIKVRSSEEGIDFSNLRTEKGHEFDIVETWIDLDSGEPEIVHVISHHHDDERHD